jgi:membrane associated rhomboid family serine protease
MALGNAQVSTAVWFEPFVMSRENGTGSPCLVHANYAHLFVNMFVLYMFGIIVEQNYAVIPWPWATAYIVLYIVASFRCDPATGSTSTT